MAGAVSGCEFWVRFKPGAAKVTHGVVRQFPCVGEGQIYIVRHRCIGVSAGEGSHTTGDRVDKVVKVVCGIDDGVGFVAVPKVCGAPN
jgi:hypothetical protein